MGGMIGMVHFDGKPVDREQLQRMADSIQHRGADGIDYWQQDHIGMAYLHLWTTPEAVNEQQPFISSDQNYVAMLHGRIDNRDELSRQLEAKSITLRTNTDVELFFGAYQAWGDTFATHIIGDFAGLIYDRNNRRLVCVRDVMGIKPFFYYLDSHRFIWASEPRPFFELTDVSLQVNEAMIGEYLALEIASTTETLYQSIYRLPPAHIMTVAPSGQTKIASYWSPDFHKTIRYKTQHEYNEHFRELFAEAIHCRLRTHGRAGSHLSGGIDSSSIVGMVQHLFRSGRATDDKGFEAFSLTFPDNPYADESHYIDAVVNQWQVPSNRLDPRAYDIHRYDEWTHTQRYIASPPNGTMHFPLEQLARDKGFRVLLSGNGGDQWFWGSLHHHLDYLTQFRLQEMFSELRADAALGFYGLKTQYQILRAVLPYLIPSPLRFRLRQFLGRATVQNWINPHFAKRIQLAERIQVDKTGLAFSSYAQGDIYQIATSARLVEALEGQERFTAFSGLELRHPFYDRRIVEFVLALPEEQRWYQGSSKRLLRYAMHSLLPDAVAQRSTKGEFSLVFPPAYQRFNRDTFFKSLKLAEKGWVNGEQVQMMYQMVNTAAQTKPITRLPYGWSLWSIFALELWFRNFAK
jgi:asparagine synthase (glutamine-hydrolysing)